MGSEVSNGIEALLAQDLVREAAEEAERRGELARAAELFERDCLFDRAARCALDAGEWQRAALLAALAGDEALLERAAERLATDPGRARGAAELLLGRGAPAAAASLLERVGDRLGAAQAFEQAGRVLDAARLLEACGQPREAARLLEAAHRREPRDPAVALALGALLVRHRKMQAGVAVLQRIDEGCAERRDAEPLLHACFEALGLADAARRLREQLGRNGDSAQAPAPAAAEPGGDDAGRVVFGRYLVVRSVASTPVAQVFLARDRLTGRDVAVKQLATASAVGAGRDAFLRLVREARALAALRHPNVVPLVELVEHAGAIVTAWMPGGSVSDLLERERVVPARAVEIAQAVLGALAEAHRLGILHRDVKPSNVLLDESGVARLADFGAAHVADASATATAGVVGTLAYMAPEQRRGEPACAASDVFGAGATLYEMLAGAPPRAGEEPVAPLSSLHPELGPSHDDALLRMLAEAPSQRVQTALEARDLLRSLPWPATAAQGTRVAEPGPAAPSHRGGRLRRLAGGTFEDLWLGRRVQVVPLDAETSRLARAWAAAACDGLPAVLRLDAASREIWLESPRGTSLAAGLEPLGSREAALVRSALERLHAQGVAHGAVDRAHLFSHEGTIVLAFDADSARGANAPDDLKALAGLA